MEPNWTLIIIVLLSAISLIVFLIWRNQKDEKEVMKSFIDEEELSVPKEPGTEDEITE